MGLRTAASAMGYGKNSAKQTFTQTGETIEILTEARKTFTNKFTLGGTAEKQNDPDGVERPMSCVFNGEELVQTIFEDDGTTVKSLATRTIKDGIITMTLTLGDVKAVRTWTKQ